MKNKGEIVKYFAAILALAYVTTLLAMIGAVTIGIYTNKTIVRLSVPEVFIPSFGVTSSIVIATLVLYLYHYTISNRTQKAITFAFSLILISSIISFGLPELLERPIAIDIFKWGSMAILLYTLTPVLLTTKYKIHQIYRRIRNYPLFLFDNYLFI